MGMDFGNGTNGIRSNINVTPLVDVVLVLLIIFMVVTPLMQKGYEASVPPENSKLKQDEPLAAEQLMVRLGENGSAWLNQERISLEDFPHRLRQATQLHRSKPVFFAAAMDLEYARVSEFLDLCYNNGAPNLVIVLGEMTE